MREKLFIDTGAYLAQFYKKDSYNQIASQTWIKMQKGKRLFVTTNHVFDELATLLGRRRDYSYAARKMKEIYMSDIIIERPEEEDEKRALEYFTKYADQNISFTDCLSFVIMHKFEIKDVFTFDKKHFEYAGFKVVP